MTIIQKIKSLIHAFSNPVFVCVYYAESRKETNAYLVSSVRLKNSFDGRDGQIDAGFKAKVYNRSGGVRSFLWKNITSITKLGWIESYKIKSQPFAE